MSMMAKCERKKYMGVCSLESKQISPRMTPFPEGRVEEREKSKEEKLQS